ncbi:tRNA (guanosine(46)-N7)-methyltransferase TrmB [Mariniphaga sediminis]|uniref:tRNA (guanine-N(7)-)-methyltransferase n=1 Tax=Mariniphaga sediminis TaxID=1628158 RepID=A0A399D2Q7_9BACT|nr:tRNA (guanosine(46)-N7)-methyltransferase TrmB [Mariniphaga sediminis]RIH65919.1 tRNA (guanosine(46)-N7)-methyltransferase TrmB [Mariniphaga sediminis]
MGKNKLAKFEEMKAFEHVVQAPYKTVKHHDFHLKGKWANVFFGNDNPLVVELGCGKGEYSVELAEKYPDKNFLGVDIKGARLWKGSKIALEKELKNVGFLRTNIEIIDQFFGPNEVDEIWLTFPDPQMKKFRKRLTSTVFLKRYQPFLKENGIIHLKTDSRFQYSYTSALVHLNEFDVIAETDNLYESEILDDTLRIKTFYEKQWLSRGIKIKYLAFRFGENKGDWKEPEHKFEKDDYRSFGRSARDMP